ncbi:MAG TPA: S9 family peptidase [Xanthobacteraceae bacterium]|jgi:dipeptidyl aminopeptidase/acylaminoacyl peptidase
MPNSAAYGSWKSPITSNLVAQSITLSETRFDSGDVYWLEGRPQELGRLVVVRANALDGHARDVIPKPYNARTRVHEYGGASWIVADGDVYFSNFADGRLYRQTNNSSHTVALTPAPAAPERQWRFADGVIDRSRQRWIGVREDHTGDSEPINTIVAVDLRRPGRSAGLVLVGGHDFFAAPRLSPDGRWLMWLTWDHPNMPWNGTTLWLSELDGAGNITEALTIAGGVSESVFQPEWSPDGLAIFFVSDRSGWWNLYRFDLASRTSEPLAPMAAEFGVPLWKLGSTTYACAGSDRIVCAYSDAGLGQLAVLELKDKMLRPFETPFTDFSSVQANGDRAVFRAGAANHPSSIVMLDLISGAHQILKKETDLLDQLGSRITDYLSMVRSVEFPTTNGKTAHGLFYPPHNPDYVGLTHELPPLLVKCHGGPTASASSVLDLTTQFWTSRGIAVLDVNYGGSTGFGRAFRSRLHLNWGIVDVDDCISGAKCLVAGGLVDHNRMVIRGGSAGGYTTLAALVFRDFFHGGASYYGVSDVAALARETHKFESRYLDWLIGPYPQAGGRYRERSPLYHVDQLSKPVIFFQGAEDAIVPPNQAEALVEALRCKGKPVGYFLFSGEQHGFRKAANIQRCLDAELQFYAIEIFKVGLTF